MSQPNKKARTEISAGMISGMATSKEVILKGENYDLKAYDNGTNNSQLSKVEGEDGKDVEKAKVNENASRQPGTGIGGKKPLAELEEYEDELDDIEMEHVYLDELEELEELERDEIEDETFDPPSSSEAIRSKTKLGMDSKGYSELLSPSLTQI